MERRTIHGVDSTELLVKVAHATADCGVCFYRYSCLMTAIPDSVTLWIQNGGNSDTSS